MWDVIERSSCNSFIVVAADKYQYEMCGWHERSADEVMTAVSLGQQLELFVERHKALVDKPFAVVPCCIRLGVLAKRSLSQLELKLNSFCCFFWPLIALHTQERRYFEYARLPTQSVCTQMPDTPHLEGACKGLSTIVPHCVHLRVLL